MAFSAGIYANGMGGGDINAVARSKEQQWVVVADDSGLYALSLLS